jgi:transcription initiation factor TFIIIB Brf1 subunit/transcription initiation factor TFIIB
MPPKRIPKARSYPRVRNDKNSDSDEDELNELFQQAFAGSTTNIEQTNTQLIVNTCSKTISDEKSCNHSETTIENGYNICTHCDSYLNEDDTNNTSRNDNTRIQYRKCPDKGIAKDLEIYNLPTDVIHLADKFYANVTQGDIKRSNLRKGIMFACVFQAYKELDNPQTPDTLSKVFDNISRKNISKGLTYFCLGSPKRNSYQYITAEHFIPKIMEKFNVQTEYIKECLDLFKTIENKSSLLNRSNPQSVSKGVVFYYLRKLDNNLSLTTYSKEVELSEITINRICNTIDSILTPT